MANRTIYEIEIRHDGLNKFRHIRGADPHVVEQKANAQAQVWDEMWQKKVDAENTRAQKEAKKEDAILRTEGAQEAISGIENTLKYTLSIDDAINWDSIKDKTRFASSQPDLPRPKPSVDDAEYQPKLSIIDKIFSSRREKKIIECKRLFEVDLKAFQEAQSKYEADINRWEKAKNEFDKRQKGTNDAIDKQKQRYLDKEPDAIIDYCDMVLSNSRYPDSFPQDYDVDYNPESRILIVEYVLPYIEDIPTISNVKYIQSQDEFSEKHLTEPTLNKLYDGLLYQIALRTIHELYEADVIDAIESIVFNGWVNSIDKATGQDVNACILSIQAGRDEFLAINLANVDPKTCFKNLKGVGSSKLHSLSPIAPIIKIDREDDRFVSAYDVTQQLDDSYNLAVMDWQDFEHLIREVFEQEFSQNGGEVKITQASRDQGVDAIAFDPDPIRGGKIVIQAKRYTNVVGVSAVRDLYGTVMNEGATKGILVTTSDYGPDAYEFVRDKPLTLLSGSNLLHLLGKYGHKAKIDLKEAKAILAERDKLS